MYALDDSVLSIKGIGNSLQQILAEYDITQVIDLLLFLPLRYEDRSAIKRIAEIEATDTLITVRAQLKSWREYRKGRLLITRATITDDTGTLNCLWFNNKFLKQSLINGQSYFFAGTMKNGQLMQATVEKVHTDAQQIHTGRIVPIYSKLGELKQGQLRRILAETIGKLRAAGALEPILHQLHFPEQAEQVITAREQLALEEIIFLIAKAQAYKQHHAQQKATFTLHTPLDMGTIQLPFTLTEAQVRALSEIQSDLQKGIAMNRLLVGDVGSGKTIVAALSGVAVVKQGQSVCLLAPTKILAQQHYEKLRSLFPEINFQLVRGERASDDPQAAAFYIGTHKLIKQIPQLKPKLVMYDEQQRFGVAHRQLGDQNSHLLTMTATPIPRSLMLSIFSHLDVSYIDQMPRNRHMATTWLVPKQKEEGAIAWIGQEILQSHQQDKHKQALIVCPFINPSTHQASENVAAIKDTSAWVNQQLEQLYQSKKIPKARQLRIGVLHSKLNKAKQQAVIDAVYNQEIDLLISTPIIEVGVDLPNADIMVIQSAERFGMSSLHQLRGRVGRAGQDSYCLLFCSEGLRDTESVQTKLTAFSKETDGLRLAHLDLQHRGAGNLLGYEQSGLQGLRFASWTNLDIITQAQQLFAHNPARESLIANYLEKIQQAPIQAATN